MEGAYIQSFTLRPLSVCLFFACLVLPLVSFAAAEYDEPILHGLRPSERSKRDEFQASFALVPGLQFKLGPQISTALRADLPFRGILGVNVSVFPIERVAVAWQLVLGYGFGGFARGFWVTLAAGIISREDRGTEFLPTAQVGWDFKLGKNFSIGPSVGYSFFLGRFQDRRRDGSIDLFSIEVALPLRVWF